MTANRDVYASGMFRDKVEIPSNLGLPKAPPLAEGKQPSVGKKCRLLTNCFSLSMSPGGAIFHYKVFLSPPANSLAEEEWVLHRCWDAFSKHFSGVFVVRSPGHIFTPSRPQRATFDLSTPPNRERDYVGHKISIVFADCITAEQVNAGNVGLASIVFQHILKRLCGQQMYQKVGRRYYERNNSSEKAQLMIYNSFYSGIQALSTGGPLLQIDTLHRAAHKRNIIEHMAACLDGDALELKDVTVQQEWRQRCTGATVLTLYNERIYRIKAVNFALNPTSTFKLYKREEKSEEQRLQDYPFNRYYQVYYQQELKEMRQPMLEAFPEKENEKVYLVPELCVLVGFNDEMRKDKNMLNDGLKQTKVAPAERLKGITEIVGNIGKLDDPKKQPAQQLMNEWKLTLNKKPVEVEATIHEPLDVSFFGPNDAKRYAIEEGSFQKYMRNGLQYQTRLDDWLFIYPESDVPVLDIWLRSLRDIAQVAFSMKMADPTRIICTDQRKQIVGLLQERLTPKTQMVVLLTPGKDARRVYQLFKESTIAQYPCATQVVKSETIRKRQSIAAVLSRIVLQMNAKFCGPLWHIDLEVPATAPAMRSPTMIIGLDVYQNFENERIEEYIGFAATLDNHCAEYYSNAAPLEQGCERESMSEKIQEFLKEALAHYAKRNSNLLPEHFIVYRASASEEQWLVLTKTEVGAITQLLESMRDASIAGPNYSPKLTYIAISKRTHMRFFHAVPTTHDSTAKNPEPGTMVDATATSAPDQISFYLINQAVMKGTANPTHYVVLHDTAGMQPLALQSLTYRLSYLYYNITGSIKMPAPAQNAKKIAHLIGTTVRNQPHKRLLCTLFYL